MRAQIASYNGAVPVDSGRWLNAAAMATWLACGLPLLAVIAGGESFGWPAAIFGGAFVLYGAALAVSLFHPFPFIPNGPGFSFLLVLLESVMGLTMMYLSGKYMGGTGATSATLVIVAAQLPYLMTSTKVWCWIGVQTLPLTLIFWSGRFLEIVSFALAVGGFQLFAAASSILARSEAAAREKLARANEELQSTRALLAESSRIAERLRISRDLHDTLGHHLTALSLQLDVAAHLADGKAAEHVTQAHAITRLLLGDVRDVVSRLRDSSRFDLAQAIRTCAGSSGELAIHVDVPGAIDVEDDVRAHALLRCVQEIVTNTTKHANARNLWITLEPRADGVALHARDDGRGAATLMFGNGLTGMRERFEEHAGTVEFSTGTGRGFQVQGFMPKPRVA